MERFLLDVDVTKDSVGTYTADGFTINTKHVQTQVNIANGGTLVIGGIYQEDNRKVVDKIAAFGGYRYWAIYLKPPLVPRAKPNC